MKTTRSIPSSHCAHLLVMLAVISTLLVAVATACSPSKDLTRSEASALIQGSPKFNASVVEVIFLGTDSRSYTFDSRRGGYVFNPKVRPFLASGYLDSQGKQILLTAKGEAACKDSPRDPRQENARSFPMANRAFVEVTGIAEVAMMGPSVKEVQFKWRWSPTAVAQELSKANPEIAAKYTSDQAREGRALLRLYDDGWRLEKIEGI